MGALILAVVVVAVLLGLAALIARDHSGAPAPPPAADAEPAWWPDFEHQFRAYAAQRATAPPWPTEEELGRHEPFGEAGAGLE